jgi:hypothetical protein
MDGELINEGTSGSGPLAFPVVLPADIHDTPRVYEGGRGMNRNATSISANIAGDSIAGESLWSGSDTHPIVYTGT